MTRILESRVFWAYSGEKRLFDSAKLEFIKILVLGEKTVL